MKPPSEAPSIPRASRAQGLSRPSSKPLLDCAANTLCEWGVGNYLHRGCRLLFLESAVQENHRSTAARMKLGRSICLFMSI